MPHECFIIAIDGTAASGKGSLSEKLAKHFKFDYLDTGKMYRLLAYHAIRNGCATEDKDLIAALMNQIDFSKTVDIVLHTEEISDYASRISVYPEVREKMNILQRTFPRNRKGVVVDGRDIGTIIFPDANIKLFITADLEVRAKRRFKQLQSMGKSVIYEAVPNDLQERDRRDINRKTAPTVAAIDAVVIDTTHLDIDAVFNLSVALTEKVVADYFAYKTLDVCL